MYYKIKTRNFVIYAAFLIFGMFSARAQSPSPPYQYPRDDLVVLMNGALFNLIDHLGGTSYGSFYHNNGTVCTTPLLSGTLSHFADVRDSEYNLLNGTVKTSVAASAWLDLQASQCTFHTIDVQGGCVTPQIPLVGPPGADFFGFAVCAVDVQHFFKVALPVPVKMPYPVVLPPNFDITLPNIPTTPTLNLTLSFAAYDAATKTWEPRSPPADTQRIWPLSGDLAFINKNPNDVSNPSDIIYRQGTIIAAKGTATHPRFFNPTASLQTAIDGNTGLDTFFKNDPNAIASIHIRDSLIAPQQISKPTDPRYGLIGGLFPLLIQGSFRASSSAPTIDFSAVISSVTVSISPNGIHPSITIEDVAASIGGHEVPAKLESTPAISIDLPTVNSNGAVHLLIKD